MTYMKCPRKLDKKLSGAHHNDDGSVAANSWGHNANAETSDDGVNEDYVIAQLYKQRTAYVGNKSTVYVGPEE